MTWLGRLHDRLARSPAWVRVPGELLLIVFVIVPAMIWQGIKAMWNKVRGK